MMIRSSNYRQERIRTLSTLIPAAQTETHSVDEAAAAHLGINRTDLRCLGAVLEMGSVSASRLADSVGLSRGAMTTALDRLEHAGFLRRIHNDADRRSIVIEATQTAKDAITRIWAPIRNEGMVLLKKYSDAELATLCRFFKDYSDIQARHAKRIRKLERTP
jgi:DNA-binding MarR family transcriptional regulator